jgi:capsular exopolysaccharide synthesis family protein
VTVVLLCLGVSGALSLAATPTYDASASLFFSLQNGNTANELAQGSTFTQNQMASYATLATTATVLQPVIVELHLGMEVNELARLVSATTPNNTVVLKISATSTSAAEAAAIANSVAENLTRAVDNLAPADQQGDPTVRSTLVAPAEPPRFQSAPNTRLNLVVGLLLGMVLGTVLALLRDAMDNRVRDAGVVADLTSLPVVGAIPTRPSHPVPTAVVEADPHSSTAEAFRHLRTNLQFLGLQAEGAANNASVVAVTSSLAAEGKSTVSVELAAALAESGARVLLVDADLRRPAVANLLGLEGAAGLTTILLGRATVADVAQDWGSSGLRVLTSGPVPPNPSELVGSPVMRRLLQELRQSHDYIILDTAPVLPVADALILSRSVDGTLLVANVTRVRRGQLTESLGALAQVEARVLGVVLNQVAREEETYSYRPSEDARDRRRTRAAGGLRIWAARWAGRGLVPRTPDAPSTARSDFSAASGRSAGEDPRTVGSSGELRPVPPSSPFRPPIVPLATRPSVPGTSDIAGEG